ncbi:hypothetical protein KP509_15G014400 [Ceratopteris richardii]|uniref:Rubisco LSMT substrate-binding domain-containing protein n=1 Tax=Ceratopteris richardii TaxID=49495 RepID=A0A8T2T4X5_CERRI|nr:hypothetical protein KP509_15G014400 [Ceratopteris richardii]
MLTMEPELQQEQQDKVSRLILWLETNRVQLRVSTIKKSETRQAGLGVFARCCTSEGVLMVTPLHLAITPMSVLQDPEFGNLYAKLFELGEVDDRLLMILFLMVERVRGSSSLWASYLDVLPADFGTPLWFTDEELEELHGTALYNATRMQLKNLRALFANKVKPFAEEMLSSVGVLEREIDFEVFLWANSIFWTRALNIPCPHSFVFPKQNLIGNNVDSEQCAPEPLGNGTILVNQESGLSVPRQGFQSLSESDSVKLCSFGDSIIEEMVDAPGCRNITDTIWVEGLVPGIDFCNHDPRGKSHWEVDGPEGPITGVPYSMYLKTEQPLSTDDEILISYGNKGNEELFFLYGFVIDDNPDDYFMVHFPSEALDKDPFGEVKSELLQKQNLTLRWLLARNFLQNGLFSSQRCKSPEALILDGKRCLGTFSWSGVRKPPSFLNQCVFPEETLAALRVIAMKERELQDVSCMLEELSQSRSKEPPTKDDVAAAVWEVCGNSRALQLLTDLIVSKLLELEEGTGTAKSDQEILLRYEAQENPSMSEKMKSCVIYRMGQKYLAKEFLHEAERLLELTIIEETAVQTS